MQENNLPGAGERRLLTGIPGLDAVLDGGLPEEHIYLVEGDPGSGKTTMALQFLLQARDLGEPVLYVTLSESVHELHLIARSHEWNLDGVEMAQLVAQQDSLLPDDQYTVFHPGDVELGTTLKGVLDHVEAVKPTRVVFDSLSEIRLLARDTSRYRRQILGLKQFFARRRCTALLLDDRPHDGMASDTTVLSIVHGVIRLERIPRDYGAKRRRLEVIKLRGLKYSDGYHDYDIQTGGLVVYPRLAAMNHVPLQPTEGSLSGVSHLDELLGGGLDRGTSTLIIGPAGSGKSSIAIQYAGAAAARGEAVQVYLFEEGLHSLYKRSSGLGIDIEQFVEQGIIEARRLDPAELSPGQLVHHIRDAVLNRNARMVLIDSLNGLLNAMAGEHQLTVQLHELLSFLNQRGVVTILVMAQHGILGTNMDSPVDLSYLADTVVLLRFFESAGQVRKAISVVKKRTGKHEDTVRELRVGPGAIAVGEPLKEFQGVLAGIPIFLGHPGTLMDSADGQ